jgi:hypothetical protein
LEESFFGSPLTFPTARILFKLTHFFGGELTHFFGGELFWRRVGKVPFWGIAVRRVLQNGCQVAVLCNFELFLFHFLCFGLFWTATSPHPKRAAVPPSTAGALSGVGGDASPAHPVPTAPASPSVSFAPPPRSLWPPRSLGRPGEPRRWRGKVDDAFLLFSGRGGGTMRTATRRRRSRRTGTGGRR